MKAVRPLYYAVGGAVILIVSLFVVALTTTAKQKQESDQQLAKENRHVLITREVVINGKTVVAEIASSPQERIKGLMYRTVLDEGKGMLFTFGQNGQYPFWMKGMKIAIDIIWIGEDLKIVDMDQNVPPCTQENCELYTPSGPIRYVLEVPAGWAQRNSIQTGNAVEFKEAKQELSE